jgi:hypothetical protein
MPEPTVIAATIRSTPYWVFLVASLVSFFLGFLLRHRLMARRFRRTNAAGVQMFRSYSHMYSTRIFEQLAQHFAQILMILAAVLAVLGVAVGINH